MSAKGRKSIALMCAGAVAILAALVVLWKSISGDMTQPQTTAPPSATESRPAPTNHGSGPIAARARPTPTSIFTPTARPSSAPSMPAASEPASEPSAPKDDGQNLQFGSKQLHAQTRAVEPLVRECVDNAVATGVMPTGTAILTYIVARHGDHLEIEDTGIDAEKTTLQPESLLTCLHQTAKAMKFEGLPRDAQEIYAARRVTLENGKITEYKHVTFSYLR